MKVVPDTVKNAEMFLRELLNFIDTAEALREQVGTYKKYAKGRSLPRFVAETSQGAMKLLVSDFETAYPTMQRTIENGAGRDFRRLHDACFKFGQLQKTIYTKKCMIMSDTERAELERTLNHVVADLAVFVMAQYTLYEPQTITVATQKICEENGITKDSLYGLMLQHLSDSGETWYSYEPMSPMYQMLMEFDSSFAEECDSNDFPLTDELTDKLVHGEVDLIYVRSALLEASKEMQEEEDEGILPSNLLRSMKLE